MGEEAKVDALVTCALKGQRTLLDSNICSLCKMIMVILVEYPGLTILLCTPWYNCVVSSLLPGHSIVFFYRQPICTWSQHITDRHNRLI